MILGFTGTRQGMTPAQRAALPGVLATLPERVLHGGAVGADREFHGFIVGTVWSQRPRRLEDGGIILPMACLIEVYPAYLDQFRWAERAFKEDAPLVAIIHPSDGNPLARNRLIVERCDHLLATPAEMTEQQRGGTWYTVRQARKMGRSVTLLLPDGSVKEEK